MSLTVAALNPAIHHHTEATVEISHGDTRAGVLAYGRNPSYERHEVRHWWLLIPSALVHFTSDALSLQWSGSARVHISKERAA